MSSVDDANSKPDGFSLISVVSTGKFIVPDFVCLSKAEAEILATETTVWCAIAGYSCNSGRLAAVYARLGAPASTGWAEWGEIGVKP
ncbi:hypothetical protein [Janthinobacterium aquaticum]|uniref:hypothetical protein n=1 Tax=Janthinobacterium sp. FT58W TaxID=2654254 RepID=UPI0012655220|nr:hypothetical protein [Janthinobacterium sp. FT58W]KAB8045234.1 hypothetical protein GCM43_02110 [Janthinobacterium sp. FT58W]